MPARTPVTPPRRRALTPAAFTLTEILVVIAIIVLLVTLSLPAISYITGSRSVDGASNVVSATLAAARGYALSEQRPCGVMFYIEPATGTVSMSLVRDTSDGATPPPSTYNFLLDRIPDTTVVSLPRGVRVQGIIAPPPVIGTTPQPRTADGYIGYNTTTVMTNGNGATIPAGQGYGPVVMFDAQGKVLAGYTYAIAGAVTTTSAVAPNNWVPSALAYPLFGLDAAAAAVPNVRNQFPPTVAPTNPAFRPPPPTVSALTLYDEAAFKGQEFTDADESFLTGSTYGTAASGNNNDEFHEEQWLEQNGAPLLINRYNGTPFRSE